MEKRAVKSLVFIIPLILIISIFSISIVAAQSADCNVWCKIVYLFTGKMPATGGIVKTITGGATNLGSGDCGAVLDRAGETYVLTEDMTGCADGLRIIADDITLDCQGHSITGDWQGQNGIYAYDDSDDIVDRVTIKNCNVTSELGDGIGISGSYNKIINSVVNVGKWPAAGRIPDAIGIEGSYNQVINSTTTGEHGVVLSGEYNKIIDSTAVSIDNREAIYIGGGSHNEVIHSSLSGPGGGIGIIFYNTQYNTIRYNTITGSAYGLSLDDASLIDNQIFQNNIYGNSINQIYFRENCPSPGTDISTLFGGGNFWGPNLNNFDPNCPGLTDSMAYYNLNGWPAPPSGPSCGDTITSDVTLTADLLDCGDFSNALEIGADDITLDCNGHSITGNMGGYGIYISGFNNITIKNCNISSYEAGGIVIDSSSNSQIINSKILASGDTGILIENSNQNRIINSFASSESSGDGITIHGNYNSIINSTAYGTDHGIMIQSYEPERYVIVRSEYNQIINSTAIGDNDQGIRIEGSLHNTVINSYASSGGGSALWLSDAQNNVITESTLTGSVYGAYIYDDSTDNLVVDNNIYGNIKQLYFDGVCPSGDLLALFGGENYWGRTSQPLFVSNEDSNCGGLTDEGAYDSLNGWITGGGPPSALCVDGDVNGDGIVDIMDGVAVMKIILGKDYTSTPAQCVWQYINN